MSVESIEVRSAERPHALPMVGEVRHRDDLLAYVQCAIELEHATLPAYLCALYSLDEEKNPEAASVLTSIFVEEMLHLALAANVLNAIGGSPVLDHPRLLPGSPRPLPHGDPSSTLSLLPFGAAALEQFTEIERPARPDAPAQGEGYATIGQFYATLRRGLCDVAGEIGEAALFCGDPARQLTGAFSYGGSGRIVAVADLGSALAALEEIVDQGEGTSAVDVWDGDRDMFHPERGEVGHYYRIQELRYGRRFRPGDTPRSGPTGEQLVIDWSGVRPMQPDPSPTDIAAVGTAQRDFDAAYCELLAALDVAFNGATERLGPAVGAMYGLKARAQALMQMPVGDGMTAGPTFRYVAPADRSAP